MEELKLSDREWKAIRISEVCDIVSGEDIYEKNRTTGRIPYITATANNNGVGYFVGNINSTLEKGCISVNRNGSVGESFYHPYAGLFGNDTRKLRPKVKNKFSSLFISSVIKKQKAKYGYGYKMGTARLLKQKIMLPINNAGNPDWQFMKDFIKQKEANAKKEIVDYYSDKTLDLIIETQSLNSIEWKEFYLRDYFDFIRGNQNNMASCNEGKFPLISAKKIDNGVKDFIADNGKNNFPSNIITLNNDGDGGVGLAYYQPCETFVDTHVTVLLPKKSLSKHILIFFIRTINIQRDKYSHGYSLNNARLNSQKIMLPINNNGDPDWQFMEDFMKKIEQDKIQTILSYYQPAANALFVERERERERERESKQI